MNIIYAVLVVGGLMAAFIFLSNKNSNLKVCKLIAFNLNTVVISLDKSTDTEKTSGLVAFPGIRQLMQKLRSKGYMLALYSYSKDVKLHEISSKIFKDTFDFVIEATEDEDLKKSIFTKAANLAECKTGDILCITDSDDDCNAAKDYGSKCIFAGWNCKDKDYLASEKTVVAVAKTIADLYKYV